MYILHGKNNGVLLTTPEYWEAVQKVSKVTGIKPENIKFAYSKIQIPMSVYEQPDFNIYDYLSDKWGIDQYDDVAVYDVDPKDLFNHPMDAWGTIVTYFADKKYGNEYPVSEIELEEALDIIKNSNTDNRYDDMFLEVIADKKVFSDENRCETVTDMSSEQLLDTLINKYAIVRVYEDIQRFTNICPSIVAEIEVDIINN